jgi:hypothetical protein
MSLICTPDSKTGPPPAPAPQRRFGEPALVTILTTQPDSAILCPMKALLQDGLQAHMPAPPEKRLLINLDRALFAQWIG